MSDIEFGQANPETLDEEVEAHYRATVARYRETIPLGEEVSQTAILDVLCQMMIDQNVMISAILKRLDKISKDRD